MTDLPEESSKIVSIMDYQPEMGFAPIAQVEAYWEALRAGRLLPKRSEVDPRGLETSLENAFILERIAPGIARIRIAGSHLGALMGMEVRGMPLTALLTPDARAILSEKIEEVCQMPAVCTLRLSADDSAGRPALEARMLLLPLKSDLGDVSRVLGCWVTQGEIGLAPRRFEMITHQTQPLLTGTPLRPFLPPPAPAPRPKAPARQATPQTGVTRGHLRLVSSND
ncbi:PAS domain-containing protein [Sulfitobacter mediterraneus]|uniref:PAS domain-containing protein n=1 Tax=Sulfitobacter mediterraneus TaxID=83219 RepID=UPI0019320FB6|nr:PAS domain-containing protein [Sulfitobacter mediterraneus]MBM1312368.1 PAS domain-containing protein [Sulfitobacter mediterraneus]MBM1316246.1 PAS domain-containing protein [Sulfitobacter mediterraneus]MBM1324612.1 PAS domain-containing protein [Sulfitobacter mediterraneus]MBM1328522.1 PAS domain-containing protein [Sulfitobacter mediterraneus]MBM1399871.1 PAS domain-containing protein [Sulfitobacter mediterraneus]